MCLTAKLTDEWLGSTFQVPVGTMVVVVSVAMVFPRFAEEVVA
jgi:hypothetical protein